MEGQVEEPFEWDFRPQKYIFLGQAPQIPSAASGFAVEFDGDVLYP
jgi:hypothetical protein